MKSSVRYKAQDIILQSIVNAALVQEETEHDKEVADALRKYGARLAKSWGITDVPGLPATKSIDILL